MVLKNERRHKIHKRPLGIAIGEKDANNERKREYKTKLRRFIFFITH